MSCPTCGSEGIGGYPFYTIVTPLRDAPELSKTEHQAAKPTIEQRQHANLILLHTARKTYVVKNRWGHHDQITERIVL